VQKVPVALVVTPAALVEDAIAAQPQIDAALRYRAAYPDEIAARIELHRRETGAADTRRSSRSTRASRSITAAARRRPTSSARAARGRR
jgi:hypothetical protein